MHAKSQRGPTVLTVGPLFDNIMTLKKDLRVEVAWAASRPAKEPRTIFLSGSYSGPALF